MVDCPSRLILVVSSVRINEFSSEVQGSGRSGRV